MPIKKLPKTQYQRSGFTLIELLVAVVISGIVLVSVMSSFWLFIQTHQKAEANRELQREVRFAMTRIADKTRNYSIKYSEYQSGGNCPPSINQNHKLCLEDHSFEFRDGNLWLEDQPIFSENKFKVNDAFFGFSPDEDPKINLGELDLQIQPKVTVYLEVESKRDSNINFEVQTSLSSRKY